MLGRLLGCSALSGLKVLCLPLFCRHGLAGFLGGLGVEVGFVDQVKELVGHVALDSLAWVTLEAFNQSQVGSARDELAGLGSGVAVGLQVSLGSTCLASGAVVLIGHGFLWSELLVFRLRFVNLSSILYDPGSIVNAFL